MARSQNPTEMEIRAEKALSVAKANLKAAKDAAREAERIAAIQTETDAAIAALSDVGKPAKAADTGPAK